MENQMNSYRKKICQKISVPLASLLICSLAAAQQPTNVEVELLRSAQMWGNKNRPDMARDLLGKLLSINPNSPEGLMFSAELSLREDKPEEARKILATLLAKHPKHAATRNLEILIRVNTTDKEKLAQMRLFARAGRKDEAARIAQELFSNGAPSSGSLGQEYHQIMGASPKSSQKVTDELTRLYRESGDPSYRLSQLEIQLNQGQVAPSVLRELENLSNQTSGDPTKLKEIWSRAIRQSNSSNLLLASAKLFLQKFPGDTAIIERLAAAQKAVEHSERIAKDPLNIARNTARRALEKNDIELAEKNLEAVLQQRPDDAESVGSLGLVRLRQGRHAEAQILFSQANRLKPQAKWTQLESTAEFWGLLRQAKASVAERDLAAATTSAVQAIKMQPDNPEAVLTLAEIKELSGDTESAQRLYDKLLQQEPRNSSALKSLAVLMSKQGRSDQALALLEKAIGNSKEMAGEMASTKANILQSKAESFIASNQFSPAIRALEAALILSPEDPWLRHKAAKVYQNLEQFSEAETVMNDGIKLAPQDAEMRYARALVRSSLEDDQGVIDDIDAIRVSQQTPKMQALQQQAKIAVAVAKAKASKNQSEQESQLVSAEAIAGNNPDSLSSIANAWFLLGQPLKGSAVFDRLQSRQPNLTPGTQLQYASLLNRAKLDSVLAQKLPALMTNPHWDPKQESSLLGLYADYQSRQIEAEQLAGNHQNALRLANLPLPDGHAENASVRDQTSIRLLNAAQDHAKLVQVIRNTLARTPNDAGLHASLVNALIKTGAFSEAAEEISWLGTHTPEDNIGERLALVRLWQESKALGQARQESDRLVAKYPNNLDVLLSAARFEQSNGQAKRALTLFRQARDTELSNTPLALPVETQALSAARKRNEQAVSTVERSPLADEIQQGIDLIEAKQLSWVEVGQKRLQKSSTDGTSTLNGWERTAMISFPNDGDGRLFFQIDQVDLNAGKLSAVNTNNETFGQIPVNPLLVYPADALSQTARGINLGAGYERDGLRFDFGFIGIGLPVTNIVGGISQSIAVGPYNLGFEMSRRPLTGSLLSYAGTVDVISGQKWGGVVATGVDGRIATDWGDYSVSASANYAVLTGQNVEDNSRLRLRFAVDRDIFTNANQQVNFGVNLSAWRYAKDLSEFTWGHGGYYSPQRYLSLSAPLEWTGHDGAMSWQLRGTASVSRSTSDASDYFPTSTVLQSLAQARLNAVFAGGEGGGTGFSLRGALEYKVAPTTSIGALLEVDRSDYYAPTSLLLYARHYFGDITVPPSKKPNPVGTYSSF